MLLCAFILLVLEPQLGFSQNFDLSTISQINVDELSNEQIEKFAQEVEKRGLTDEQVSLFAKARGVSEIQISKLLARINSLDVNHEESDIREFDRERKTPSNDEQLMNGLFTPLVPPSRDTETSPIFGMEYFTNSNLTFEPNLNVPTPKDYILGAGDQLIIDIWGASEQNYVLSISPEGSIFIPSVGPVYLSGLKIDDVTERVKSRLKTIYSGLGSNTYFQVSLGQIRTIKVNIVGEVLRPGSYSMSSFSTVLNALYFAGGPSIQGSLRQVEVFRNGKLLEALDLYEVIIEGKQSFQHLMDNDLIIVRPYYGRVLIEGAVKRNGYFETKEGESLATVLKLAGGFSDYAYRDNITVRRNQNLRKTILSIPNDQFEQFVLQGGDELMVSEVINEYTNRVQIDGAINKPGEYELVAGMTLLQLINKAEGLKPDAFLKRAVVLRTNKDKSLTSISVNLEEIVKNEKNVVLQKEDFIKIQSKFDLREEYQVRILGEINSPGDYPYVEDMSVADLVYLANGFKESAASSFVEVARRVNSDISESSKSSEIINVPIDSNLEILSDDTTFSLQPFDLVVVRKSPNYSKQEIVEVEGEIIYPGKYSISQKNERVSDLLQRAGGLTKFAYVKGATLIRRTEYFTDPDEDSEAAKQRRENLLRLSERDTLLADAEFEIKQQESIGIELHKILSNPGSRYDLVLKEGDILSIPRLLQTVRLRGELLYPATVRYDKGLSFKKFISQAGGFSDKAKKGKSYIIYANGSAERTKKFLWFNFFPSVEPGSEIIVPRKQDRVPMSFQAWIALATSATTMALAVQQIIN